MQRIASEQDIVIFVQLFNLLGTAMVTYLHVENPANRLGLFNHLRSTTPLPRTLTRDGLLSPYAEYPRGMLAAFPETEIRRFLAIFSQLNREEITHLLTMQPNQRMQTIRTIFANQINMNNPMPPAPLNRNVDDLTIILEIMNLQPEERLTRLRLLLEQRQNAQVPQKITLKVEREASPTPIDLLPPQEDEVLEMGNQPYIQDPEPEDESRIYKRPCP